MSEQEVPAGSVAIIGMAGRLPGARSVEQLWENLCQGVEARTVFSDAELEAAGVDKALREQPAYVRAGFVLDNPELFDAAFFGIPPREAEVLDPQHRLFLECAWEALERAGHAPDTFPGSISLYASVGLNHYLLNHLLPQPDVMRSVGHYALALGNDKDFLPTRVSHKLNLRGASVCVQTACSSSLVAVHLACQSLLALESDMALAGGVSLSLPQHRGYLYEEGGINSPDGHCRAFDARSGGTVGGSGVAVVVLKRLEDALKDGDFIHAVIRGSAINNDGTDKVGYTAPSVNGQAKVISEALAVAGVEPGEIHYVEAHGTGTVLGDPIEVAALNQAFHGKERARQSIALGSLKTNVGHLDTAAGVAGLIKAALAVQHGKLPPSLHFQSPNPRIDFAGGPFYVNPTLRDWPAQARPRRAAVSSFGIGGTNAHAILEQAPAPREAGARPPWKLLMLSAHTAPALEQATEQLARHLERTPEAELSDVAWTLHVGRQRFEHRRVLVCRDTKDALDALARKDPQRLYTQHEEATERPVAFLLPGQGLQHVGMARELYETEPIFREHLEACCTRLKPHLGLDLRQVLYPAPGEEEQAAQRLRQTELAQPALFAVEYALARLWRSWGVRPQAMLGHSLGEYVAACLAEVFSLDDALALVAARGQLMQRLPPGAMLSVQLPEAELLPLLGERLSLAAVNAPRLCVASGPEEAMTALEAALRARGVEHRRLHTSHAFHSAMMDPLLGAFAERMRQVRLSAPKIPYVSNLTGTWVTPEQATDPGYWVKHLRSPVLFAQGVATLLDQPERALLEVGPGQVLGQLARQGPAAGRVFISSLPAPQEERSAAVAVRAAAGRLWLSGVRLEAKHLHGAQRRRLPLPTYPFQRERYWVDPPRPGAQAAASQDPARKQPDVADWLYVPGWQTASLPAATGALEGRCLVLMDSGGLGEALAAALEAAGTEVIRAPVEADVRPLLASLRERGGLPGRILHLGGEAGFYSLLALARALVEQPPPEPVELTVIASGTQEVTGEEPLSPGAAKLLGPCRVIPQEGFPKLRCQLIDVVTAPAGSPHAQRLVRQLLEELRAGPLEPVVALRGGRRWVEHFEPVRLEPAAAQGLLRERGVYLLTGGLGRIGLGLAAHLGSTLQARLVLVGRTPLPPREQWASSQDERVRQLLALEQQGAEVLTLQADVSDEAQLRQVVERTLRHFGALHGVVHGAGSVGRHTVVPLHEVEPAACEEQFRAKVRGLQVLHQVLQGVPLDFVVLQSSLSTVLGGLGFSAYAAANAFMDTFAAERAREPGPRWLSIGWDGWQDASDAKHDTAMSTAEGVEVFRRLLAGGHGGRCVISTAPLEARRETSLLRHAAVAAPAAPQAKHSRPSLQTEYLAPRDGTEQRIAKIWQELLGIERVGANDDFFDLGGHSLLATQVLSHVREAFDVDLPVRALFEAPTVAGLALAVVQQRAAAVDQSTLESLLAELE